jgi:SagB-type dehydrogenase family enzyme
MKRMMMFLVLTGIMIIALLPALVAAAPEKEGIKLPPPRHDGTFSLDRALAERRSVRVIKDEPIMIEEVSQLLWATQGVSDTKTGHRTVPSAMAVYPVEVYLIAGKVKTLPAGIYHYAPQGHLLVQKAAGDNIKEFCATAVSRQEWVTRVPAIVIITGVKERMTNKTGERGAPWVYVEAGLAAQNFFLEAVALGLGSTYVGGFEPDKVSSFLRLSPGEEPIAVLPVGKK